MYKRFLCELYLFTLSKWIVFMHLFLVIVSVQIYAKFVVVPVGLVLELVLFLQTVLHVLPIILLTQEPVSVQLALGFAIVVTVFLHRIVTHAQLGLSIT